MEQWKQHLQTRYSVSNYGRVSGIKGQVITPYPQTNGYLRVGICSPGGTVKTEYVHRMVAIAFIGPPPTADHQIDHIDHNRANNNVTNLRWMTKQDNLARRLIARGEGHFNSRLTAQDVEQITAMAGQSSVDVAQQFGVAPRTIRDIWNHKTWKEITNEHGAA